MWPNASVNANAVNWQAQGHWLPLRSRMYSGLSEMVLWPTPGITVRVASDLGKCLRSAALEKVEAERGVNQSGDRGED
jgi:hypothetical protein